MRTPPEPPVPTTRSVFSCPSTPDLNRAAMPYPNPPNFSRAVFMYGENGRLCINRSTRATLGISNTKFVNIQKPVDTVLVAEVDPNSPQNASPAQSNVTGQYRGAAICAATSPWPTAAAAWRAPTISCARRRNPQRQHGMGH